VVAAPNAIGGALQFLENESKKNSRQFTLDLAQPVEEKMVTSDLTMSGVE
jgi:hypothetical protein